MAVMIDSMFSLRYIDSRMTEKVMWITPPRDSVWSYRVPVYNWRSASRCIQEILEHERMETRERRQIRAAEKGITLPSMRGKAVDQASAEKPHVNSDADALKEERDEKEEERSASLLKSDDPDVLNIQA